MVAEPARRDDLIKRAFALEAFSIAWMAAEAAIAVVAGVMAHSVTLVAFGLDSVIELASAGVLLWRLIVELKRGRAFSEAVEARASKIAGALLFALAGYVAVSATWSLWRREGEAFSPIGLAVAIVAIPTMALLARAKLRVAEALESHALRADAVEAIACGYLSFVVVIGLVAQLLLRAWWVDGVTSLALTVVLIREAREAWEGDEIHGDESDGREGRDQRTA
jgi:divalent metal cation (Fe/Co/Zn/Cd) transporter